jgi:rhomboid family protein
MFGVTTSDDYRPVTWIGRYPVRIITIVVAIYVLGMFGTVILSTAHVSLTPFAFNAQSFVHDAFWQPLTCTLIQSPSFFFLISMLFLHWSGAEVEKLLGRNRFLLFFGLLLLMPPSLILIWSALGQHWTYAGSYELTVGMFIAFATLYPNVEMFGWVTLKWLAFAGLVLASMQYLPNHDWGYLSVLWGMCLASFWYIRFVQGLSPLDMDFQRFNLFKRKPKFHIVQKSASRRVVEPEDVYASIDPILDKIAKSGIGSLTAHEKQTLDRARNRLLKKSD